MSEEGSRKDAKAQRRDGMRKMGEEGRRVRVDSGNLGLYWVGLRRCVFEAKSNADSTGKRKEDEEKFTSMDRMRRMGRRVGSRRRELTRSGPRVCGGKVVDCVFRQKNLGRNGGLIRLYNDASRDLCGSA